MPLQTAELTIENNAEIIYKVGSRKGTTAIAKERNYALKYTVGYTGPTELDSFYGSDGAVKDGVIDPASTTATLIFSNGLSGSDERTITINLSNIYYDEESLPLKGTDMIGEEITAFAKSCTSIVAEDNTATSL